MKKKATVYPGQTEFITTKESSTVARLLIGLPYGPVIKKPTASAGHTSSSAIPVLGRFRKPQNYQVQVPQLLTSDAASPDEAHRSAHAPDKEKPLRVRPPLAAAKAEHSVNK